MSWLQLKQKGNVLFEKQDYEGAVKFYTKALELSPSNHTVYSNRSIAFYKLEQFDSSLQDASKCIELQPTFARGYQRKCVALNALGMYEEAIIIAQEGYKLRGSDAICQICVAQWLIAIQAVLKQKIERVQKEIEFEFPKQYSVVSDTYLEILLDVFVAYSKSDTEGSLEKMSAHLVRVFQELDRVLLLFGHKKNPFGTDWVIALCDASNLDPSSAFVPQKFLSSLLEKSRQQVRWLHEEVDHILYPILRPFFCLIVMIVNVRCTYLGILTIEKNVVEVYCRACLPFFDKGILSFPEYSEQEIQLYSKLLSSIGLSARSFDNDDDIKYSEYFIRKLQSLLEQSPDCDPEIRDTALITIATVQIAIGQTPDDGEMPFKKAFMSGCSLEEVLSFLEAKLQPLTSSMDIPLEDPLPDFVFRNSQILLSCTVVLLKAGMLARAIEIFRLGELITVSILQRRFLSQAYTLDTVFPHISLMRGVILFAAKSFLGYDNDFLAGVIVRWKSVFSELRSLLMQFGLGAKYLETFNALQEIHLHGNVPFRDIEDQLMHLSDMHQKKIQKLIPLRAKLLLNSLFQQDYQDIQQMLNPEQIVLEFLSVGDVINTYQMEEYDFLLLVLQAEKAPIVKPIVNLVDHSDKINVFGIDSELYNSLIPKQVQEILCSSGITQVFLCLDPSMHYLPFDLLSLPDGQQLGDKCTIVYLSAARELLRKSTLTAAQQELLHSQELGQSDSADAESQILSPLDSASSPKALKCFIFADPNFDLVQDGEVSADRQGVLQKMIAVMSTIFVNPSSHEIAPFACRLPKSLEEAHEVEYILKAEAMNPIETQCIFGDAATLSSALQVKSPFILHFSTHGFSMPTTVEHAFHGTFVNDTKCGLLLAGANTFHHGELSKVVPAAGTGMLTALAAMGMNLRNTRLVYLSTCVSARGTSAPDESINSLAAAFRAAGAQTVVATLWTVLENEARIFAVHFYYEACKAGVKPSQALASAKRKMKESGHHWVIWSGFICIGEDVPLFSRLPDN